VRERFYTASSALEGVAGSEIRIAEEMLAEGEDTSLDTEGYGKSRG